MTAALLAALAAVWERERDRLLSLEARRRLWDHVRAFPGLHQAEVARALGMDANHVKYHLERLERSGLVAARREGGYVQYFPREEGPVGLQDTVAPGDKRVIALLRRPVPLHATLLLLDRGEATHAELLEEVGVAHGTLHYHLQRMEAAGLVESERQGRERRYRIAGRDRVEALLLRHRPPDALVQGFIEAWEALEL